MTTGLFPQEIILQTNEKYIAKISKIKLLSCNVRGLEISVSSKTQPVNFDKVIDIELEDLDRQKMQLETFNLNSLTSRFLRIRINSGWDDFVSIHYIQIEGSLIDS